MKNFILATNNFKKAKEMREILAKLGINALTAAEAGITLDDVEETGSTFAENAKIKAMAAMQKSGLPSIADDSGLMVDALGGKPGVYSARYAATDEQRVDKLLLSLKGEKNRKAKFVCSICLVFPDKTEFCAEGECQGEIAVSPAGNNGFGYDPIFITQTGKTFAELTATEKDEISHRGKALREFAMDFAVELKPTSYIL